MSWYVRLYICEALGSIGISSKEVIVALCECTSEINEPDAQVRFTAALALVKLKSEESVECLSRCLKDNNRYVREFALIALERIKTKESLELFTSYRHKYKGLDPLTTNTSQY